jgi:hypothetical protein
MSFFGFLLSIACVLAWGFMINHQINETNKLKEKLRLIEIRSVKTAIKVAKMAIKAAGPDANIDELFGDLAEVVNDIGLEQSLISIGPISKTKVFITVVDAIKKAFKQEKIDSNLLSILSDHIDFVPDYLIKKYNM